MEPNDTNPVNTVPVTTTSVPPVAPMYQAPAPRSNIALWMVILGLLVVLGGGAIVYAKYARQAPAVAEDMFTWKTYTNTDLHISFEYPESWGEPVVAHQAVDLSKCEGALMKTYLPNRYSYTDSITFKGAPSINIGLVRFSESHPNGCDDSGVINLVEKAKAFNSQKVGITDLGNNFRTEIFSNEQGTLTSYYPDYYDSIGTQIDQIYDFFGPNLLVQARATYAPYYGTPELDEISKYECKQDQKYGTCGLTKWLREGTLSKNIRYDFAGLDHVVKTFKFTSATSTTDWKTYTNNELGFSIDYPYMVQGQPVRITRKGNEISIMPESFYAYSKELLWNFKVVDNINSDKDISTFLAKEFGGSDCRFISMTPSVQPRTYDVTFDEGSPDGNCWVNYVVYIKYSPTAHKIVIWDVGQDSIFDGQEDKMGASLRIL